MLKKNPGPPLTSKTKGSKDAIPQEFIAKVGTTEVKQKNPVDVEPDDPTGLLIESKVDQTLTDEKEKTNTSFTQDPTNVPLVSSELLPNGQVGTKTRTLVPEGTALATTATTQRADQHNLGNGKLDQTVVEAPSVFKEGVYEKQIPDVVPEEFRTGVPTTITEETSAGVADTNPMLNLGELSRRETQIADLLKRVRVVSRATLTLPVVLTDKIRTGITGLGSFFSRNGLLTRTLNSGLQALDQGFLVIESKVKDLGNGQSLKETTTVPDYPVLTDNIIDERYGVVRNRVKSVVATGTANPAGASQYAQNSDQTIRVIETIDSTSLGAVAWKMFGTTNVDLPPELQQITAWESKNFGSGGYSEAGSYGLAANGSGGISLRGHAQGSASALIEISYLVKQVWGNNKPCTNVLFFADATTSRAGLLSRAGAIAGVSVTDWPKFVPQEIVVVCIGGKIVEGLELAVTAHDVVVSKFDGSVVRSGSARTSGGGISVDVGTSTNAVRIPATIHPAITVGGTTFSTASFQSSSSIQSGVNGEVGVLSGSANASVLTTSFGATPGTTTIPTSGNFAHRILSEPYIPGVVMVQVEIVDFSVF